LRYAARVNAQGSPSELPFLTRLWFAWVCLIRVLFDARFAARAWSARAALPAAPPTPSLPAPAPVKSTDGAPKALQLLSLLQREGRLVDFLEQDITGFSDQDVGAAARLVHQGCRETLRRLTTVQPVRAENEGSSVTLEAGFAASEVKLIGDVKGSPPYRGTLRHRGWRVATMNLPTVVEGHDDSILAPAEVEL
jgi:hypothetical protein